MDSSHLVLVKPPARNMTAECRALALRAVPFTLGWARRLHAIIFKENKENKENKKSETASM
jgi:hypothetical protein